jgi:hypothetical protein
VEEDHLHGRKKDKKERKQLERPRPRIIALHAKQDSLLACNKPIFELPIHDRMQLHSRDLETWALLVTSNVKRAPADAEQCLRDTNHDH